MIETHTKMEGEVIITNFQVRFPTTLLQQQDQIRCGGVSFCIAVTHPSTEGKVLWDSSFMWEFLKRLAILCGPKALSPVLSYQKSFWKFEVSEFGRRHWESWLRFSSLKVATFVLFLILAESLLLCHLGDAFWKCFLCYFIQHFGCFHGANILTYLIQQTKGSALWRWGASIQQSVYALNRRHL